MTRTLITFHGIGTPPRELSPEERAVWIDHATFVAVLDRVASRPNICLTFDDGNESDVAIALPELLRRGLRAEFFVLAGRLDEHGYLDRAAVMDLRRHGMHVGSHGMHHIPWRRMSAEKVREELIDARVLLSDLLATDVTTAACPFGAYDRSALGHLRRAGYQRVYTSDGGPARDTWLQPRTTVRQAGLPISDRDLKCGWGRRTRAVFAAKRLVKRWR